MSPGAVVREEAAYPFGCRHSHMPIDFRYHLASLLAVFCALLIGVLLGIALVGDPSLENQLRAFKQERADNRTTIAKLALADRQHRAFGKQVLPYLADQRLRGVRVAVIVNRDLGDAPWVEAVITTLRHAGAQITSTTVILPKFTELERKDIAKTFAEFGFPIPIEGEPRSVLAGKLAAYVAEGRPELPYRLRQLGLIRREGDYSVAADSVLLVGGTDTDLTSINEIDLPIIRALQEVDKRVIACEESGAQLSAMHVYQRRAIPTVDNADTVAGQLALVLVVAGASGNYGVKSTADQLLPPLQP
jgi:hypothetical protein